MTQRLLLSCLALAFLSSTGCSMFSKKNAKPKESSAIAGEVEESLKKRWVDKRVAELMAQGVAADPARTQATQEFRDKFEYIGPAKK